MYETRYSNYIKREEKGCLPKHFMNLNLKIEKTEFCYFTQRQTTKRS